MYIALSYIGGKFVPGEVLPSDLPKDTLDWLLRSGAAEKVAEPAPKAAPVPEIIVEDAEIEVPKDIDASEGVIQKKPRKSRAKK